MIMHNDDMRVPAHRMYLVRTHHPSRRYHTSRVDYDDYDDYDDGYTVESSAPQTGQDIQPSSSLNAASAALGIASAETAAEEETDWVMGSDGYWWYHDKEANEWWYKDENGEIVKFD